jgi:hypothetical protein
MRRKLESRRARVPTQNETLDAVERDQGWTVSPLRWARRRYELRKTWQAVTFLVRFGREHGYSAEQIRSEVLARLRQTQSHFEPYSYETMVAVAQRALDAALGAGGS